MSVVTWHRVRGHRRSQGWGEEGSSWRPILDEGDLSISLLLCIFQVFIKRVIVAWESIHSSSPRRFFYIFLFSVLLNSKVRVLLSWWQTVHLVLRKVWKYSFVKLVFLFVVEEMILKEKGSKMIVTWMLKERNFELFE